MSNENGETDLKFRHVDASDACAGCKAHEGFWGASNAAIEELKSSVESAAKENPEYKIIIVGHSLGGALATLGAVSLRNSGHTVDMVRLIFAIREVYLTIGSTLSARHLLATMPLRNISPSKTPERVTD